MTASVPDWIGREQSAYDLLTQSMVDRMQAVLDVGANSPNLPLPLGIHWLLAPPVEPMGALGEDGHPARGGFMPPIVARRRMWASSTVEFCAPMRAGTSYRHISRIVDITSKQGASGLLWFVDVDHAYLASGKIAVEERQTIVYTDAPPRGAPPPAPVPVREDWQFERHVDPDPVLLFRYSALAFNGHRIHYDLPYAQQVEGYPQLVVHGPLIATLLLDLIARQGRGWTVRSFAYRARSPAYAGDPLRLVGRADRAGIELAAIGPDERAIATVVARLDENPSRSEPVGAESG